MTNEERYITQGRARDAAKQLRAEIATLRVFFDEYCEKLDNTKSTIARFLSEPFARAADERPMIDHVARLQRELNDGVFFNAIGEFADKTRKLRQLEEQIKEFE